MTVGASARPGSKRVSPLATTRCHGSASVKSHCRVTGRPGAWRWSTPRRIEAKLQRRKKEREKYVEDVVALIETKLKERNLEAKVQGRFCLVGVTSTGTTDVSAIPLQEQYVNLGVHANLIDQMLAGMPNPPSAPPTPPPSSPTIKKRRDLWAELERIRKK